MKQRIVCGHLRALVLATGILAGASYDTAYAAWEVAHADRANRGRADVTTAPARSRSKSVPGLGTFAPGSGPVIAPDGTVYLGTLEGKLIALHADGRPFWSRDITTSPTAPKQRIVASPAVGADGSIYVIGTKRLGKAEATLHIFTPSGGFKGSHAFPQHGTRGSRTSAPPNIARIGNLEVVLVPVLYRDREQPRELRIVGFSTTGNVVIDEFVSPEGGVDVVTGSIDCGDIGPCFKPPRIASGWRLPMPGVAIFTFVGGGAPHVIVTEPPHRVHGFTLSDKPALTRTFRSLFESRTVSSPPMALPDNHTMVGTDRGVVFAGPNASKLPPVTSNLGAVWGAPTLLADGRVVVVDDGPKGAGIALIKDGQHVGGRSFPTRSMVSAAASRTHIFVSTADAFFTLDANTLEEVAKIDLLGGGVSTPAIGPQGHVYTIVSNILFVFPPPGTMNVAPGGPQMKPQ